MANKTSVQDENFFRKIIRTVVNEELTTPLERFQNAILRTIDGKNAAILGLIEKKNNALLEAIDKKNYDLRSDLAKMKDEIVGELQTVRQEQTILSGQHSRVIDNEERLEKLEEIHPQGHHAVI